MVTKNARVVLSLITKLIDSSKEYVTNDIDCIFNLKGTGISSNELSAILPYLRSENLIKYTDSDTVIEDISLTEYGKLYPNICKQEIFETVFISIICPILVAFFTALITTLITLAIR